MKHLIGALSPADPRRLHQRDRRHLQCLCRKRYAEAAPLIKRAAEDKHLDGMAILGVMYLYGNGVEKDGRKAEPWLSRADEAGQVSAQSIPV